MSEFITDLLIKYSVGADTAKLLTKWIMVVIVILLSMFAKFITRKVVLQVLTHYITNNRFKWDNIMLERKVFNRLAHVVPALIIYYFAPAFPTFQLWIEKGAMIYLTIVGLTVISSLLNATDDIYRTYDISKEKPIKGYIQVVKIFIYVIGTIIVIANLIGESPFILLSGIGALSAVFMLIFKDSILGLVAGVQLTANDMVRVGDWVEIPQHNADGDVIDISLNTVKVQNWDKTITTVPAYALISESFKNWRGMQESGGRRIKRSIYIDMNSIDFCSDDMIEYLKSIFYLSEYITEKQKEIEAYNKKHQYSDKVNGRALTNIGCFREYIKNYLLNHPGINQHMTAMVRQLDPDESGLPLEIYAFSNDVRWAVHESIQSDIFDHLFSIAAKFNLRVFQNPTGHDLVHYRREQEEIS